MKSFVKKIKKIDKKKESDKQTKSIIVKKETKCQETLTKN